MFGILAVCLRTLDRGATVFFDELDRSLHPILLIELVKLFKLKKFNKHGAQLVFTAHDPSIMEDVLMRVGEIGIVNNNVHSGSTLTRLVDMKDKGLNVRNVHNFRKMYMEGFFAGVPYPVL
jgi:AAA15 family ATPase/GTPase